MPATESERQRRIAPRFVRETGGLLQAVPIMIFLAAALLSSGCRGGGSDEPQSDDGASVETSSARAHLTLSSATGGGNLFGVGLEYQPAISQSSRPRLAEVYLRCSGELQFRRVETGAAATSSGKVLVAQEQADNTIRLVFYSAANTNPMGAGSLATVYFERITGGDATVEILDRRPIFAPADADSLLDLGAALRVR